jgi:alanine dehydrogenase
MRIAVMKEIKNHEYRVALTPEGAERLTMQGHRMSVEANAGAAVGFSDGAYIGAGAIIESEVERLWQNNALILKVKEPQLHEIEFLSDQQTIFTYLHLAPDPQQTHALMQQKCTAIAYESVTDKIGTLPLLAPMSEIAGRLSVQAGAHHLEKTQGGRGILLGGIAGVKAGKVCIVGAGVVGLNALQMAVGLGAQVTILDINMATLRQINQRYGNQVQTLFASSEAIAHAVKEADLVIGAVLIPGASAPKLVTEKMIKTMKAGSVVVDVAIDQGGCFETSHATSHDQPTFIKHGVIHYCVANMPGAAAFTATQALTQVTLPFIEQLANSGIHKALTQNPHLADGVNIYQGELVNAAVANAQNKTFVTQPWL